MTRILRLLGVLCLIVLSVPAAAQEETPSPDTTVLPVPTERPTERVNTPTPQPTATPRPEVAPFIFTWEEETIFPQVVRFTLTVSRPINEIANLTIVMRPEGQAERTIPVDVEDNAVTSAEGYTDFEFIWPVPSSNPLPFKALVEYNWVVALSNNQSAQVPGVFAYDNPDINWIIDEDPDERLSLMYPDGQIDAERIRRETASIYELLAANLGRQLQFRLALISATVPFDPCTPHASGDSVVIGPRSNREIPCETDVASGILRNLAYDSIPLESLSPGEVLPSLWTHLVQSFYAPEWAGDDIPLWYQAGITRFYSPGDKFSLLSTVREAARQNQLYSLNEMQSSDVDNVRLWEAQSYAMVLYIANHAGVSAVFDLANPAASLEDETIVAFNDRYQTLVGQSLAALLPSLSNWVFTRTAESDSRLNLYSGPTPSPIPTNTITPFPATATATATDTPTITSTATATGFLSATPLPSLTPTNTFTPAPPTITPRPAVSFRDLTLTAVAVPVQSGSSISDSEIDPVLIGGVIAIFVVLAGLIAYALMRGREA